MGRGFVAGLGRALVSALTVGVVIALVLWAVSAAGYPQRELDLNDTGIWISNNAGGEYGRINKAAVGLDAHLSPPGARAVSYDLDILQDGNQVVGWDQTNGVAIPIDTATGRHGEQSVGVAAAGALEVRGGTAALLDPTGKVWATRYDPLVGGADVSALGRENKPLIDLGSGGKNVPAALAVGVDGTVYAANTGGRLVAMRIQGSGFTVSESTLCSGLGAVSLTAVGGTVVALDATTGKLCFSDGRTAMLPIDPVAKLQLPSDAADTVLVASAKAFFRVGLVSGQVVTLDAGGDGAPAAPVRLNGCEFGAWAGVGRVVRACEGAGVEVQQVDRTGGLVRPVFRINHGLILLNDQANGRAWDLDAKVSIDNWPDANPQGSHRQQQEQQAEVSKATPHAVDDDLKARSERTTVLHLLDNDTDTAGGILSIQGLNTKGVPDGVELEIAPDGQAVKLFLPKGASAVKFGYTISNGRLSDEGQVIVHDAGNQETAPYQVNAVTTPHYAVTSFGSVSMAVLPTWRDAEGDPISVVAARDGSTPVAVSADGVIEYTAAEETRDHVRTVSYTVSDGGSAGPKSGAVRVRVLARKSTAAVAATAGPDTARGQVGEPIVVFPLANDLPGADPRNLNATMMLNGPVAQKANLTVTTDVKTGQVQVVAAQPGPYFLEYSVAFGSAVVVKGAIRVDAFTQAGQGPVTMPDQATVRGRVPILIDVLGNDYDPAGGLLTVQSVTPADPEELSAQVIAGRWIRVLAQTVSFSPNPQVIHYEVTNGSQSAAGDVSLTQLPEPAEDVVLANNDAATVRVGDTAEIDVLKNDTSISGQRLTLVSNGLGTDAIGELTVANPALAADADQGDVGRAFIRGDKVRYVAPVVMDGDRQVVVTYTAQNPDGVTATSRVLISLLGEPTEDDPDRAPNAGNVDIRVVAGSRVKIPIPTSGQDPDGDTVTVSGIASAPALGRVVGRSPNSLTYEAFPTVGLVGTDSFQYVVADKYGLTGVGTIRIAVSDPGQTQAPAAIDDQFVAAPGVKVHANVVANDLVARDDQVRLAALSRTNSPLPEAVSAETEIGPISAVAPGVTAQPVVFNYALVGNAGAGPQATVAITSREGYNNPPVVIDHTVEVEGSAGTVHLLGDAWDVEDGAEELTAHLLAPGDGTTLVGDQLSVTLADHPQVIPYQVTDSGGAVSAAVVFVPAAAAPGPQLKPQGNITLASDSSASFAISDYVDSPRTKIVKIASADAAAAPGDVLAVHVDDANRFTLVSSDHYIGPASVTLEVMDANSATAVGVVTATVSIPVQIGAPTPVLRCPETPQTVVQGGEEKALDIASLCHMWSPSGTTAGVSYTADWTVPIAGVQARTDGSRVTIQAAGGAPDQGEGVLRIGIAGTAAKPAELPVKVVAAAAPQLRSVRVPEVMAGTAVNVPLSISSPLLDAKPAIVEVAQVSGGRASVAQSGATLSVTPAESSTGTLVFRVVVTDLAADPRRESRWVEGVVTVQVYAAPEAPSAPRSASTIQSHAVSLAWTAGDPHGASIDSYQVRVASGPGAGRIIASRSSALQVTGLINGKPVTFEVRAHNKGGWSRWSARSAPVTPDAVPGAPAWVKVSDPQNHSVLVSWGAITNDGSPITAIHVSGAGVAKNVTAGTRSVRMLTPSNNEPYTFSVTAGNSYDLGPTASVRGQSSGRPSGLSLKAPAPVSALGAATAVKVSWTLGSSEGPTPVAFTVVRSDGKKICVVRTATSCTDDTVTYNGKSFTYTVTAANATGGAAHSASAVSPKFAAVGTPDKWGGWTASPTGADGKVKLTYVVPASRGTSSQLTLLRDGKALSTLPSPGPNGGARTYTVSGLTDGSSYGFALKVCNEAKRCAVSSTRSASSFGPLAKPKITSATVSGTTISAKATANGNGRTATLKLSIAGVVVATKSGKGSLSVSGSRSSLGYSTTYTIKATLTTARTTPTRGNPSPISTTRKTGAKPPPRSVRIGFMTTDPSMSRMCVGAVMPGCTSVRLVTTNFEGSYSCTLTGGDIGWGSRTLRLSGDRELSPAWVLGMNGPIYATCDGVRSNTLT